MGVSRYGQRRYVDTVASPTSLYLMRRDYFTIEARDLDWLSDDAEPEKPTMVITFEGPASLLEERITGLSTELLDDSEVDVSFRYRTDVDAEDAHGVISITDRVTGDYVLELNADSDEVQRFVRAARTYGKRSGDETDRYRIDLRIDGEQAVTYDKRTFLIYNRDGNLLRKHSLIPSGIEL